MCCLQDDNLTGTSSSSDATTKENLEKLAEIGESLLSKTVSRVNLITGLTEPIDNGGTNADALKRYNDSALFLAQRFRFWIDS